jgi:hypothetical protein
MRGGKYWEIIADNLSEAGWSWGCVSAIDSSGRTIWIVDAHRDDGKRFVVRADGKLTAFLELESAIYGATALNRPPAGPGYINKDEMKKLLAIGVGAIVAGVLGAIFLPVHLRVENRDDELAKQERELVQRIADEKRIDLDSVPSPTP